MLHHTTGNGHTTEGRTTSLGIEAESNCTRKINKRQTHHSKYNVCVLRYKEKRRVIALLDQTNIKNTKMLDTAICPGRVSRSFWSHARDQTQERAPLKVKNKIGRSPQVEIPSGSRPPKKSRRMFVNPSSRPQSLSSAPFWSVSFVSPGKELLLQHLKTISQRAVLLIGVAWAFGTRADILCTTKALHRSSPPQYVLGCYLENRRLKGATPPLPNVGSFHEPRHLRLCCWSCPS